MSHIFGVCMPSSVCENRIVEHCSLSGFFIIFQFKKVYLPLLCCFNRICDPATRMCFRVFVARIYETGNSACIQSKRSWQRMAKTRIYAPDGVYVCIYKCMCMNRGLIYARVSHQKNIYTHKYIKYSMCVK